MMQIKYAKDVAIMLMVFVTLFATTFVISHAASAVGQKKPVKCNLDREPKTDTEKQKVQTKKLKEQWGAGVLPTALSSCTVSLDTGKVTGGGKVCDPIVSKPSAECPAVIKYSKDKGAVVTECGLSINPSCAGKAGGGKKDGKQLGKAGDKSSQKFDKGGGKSGAKAGGGKQAGKQAGKTGAPKMPNIPQPQPKKKEPPKPKDPREEERKRKAYELALKRLDLAAKSRAQGDVPDYTTKTVQTDAGRVVQRAVQRRSPAPSRQYNPFDTYENRASGPSPYDDVLTDHTGTKSTGPLQKLAGLFAQSPDGGAARETYLRGGYAYSRANISTSVGVVSRVASAARRVVESAVPGASAVSRILGLFL